MQNHRARRPQDHSHHKDTIPAARGRGFAFADFSGKYDYRSGRLPTKSKEMLQCISLWEIAMI
jgi:hypothetical protein